MTWAGTTLACIATLVTSMTSLLSNVAFADDVNCDDMKQMTFMIDGQPVKRFSIPELKYLKCVQDSQPSLDWNVTRMQWEASDEAEWQSFVKNLGLAVESHHCSTVDGCMLSQANPYRDTDGDAYYYSDCAKYPIFLRAYFSFKKSLPFSYVSGVAANRLTPSQQADLESDRQKAEDRGDDVDQFDAIARDVRYSRNGNYPVNRMNIPSGSQFSQKEFYSTLYEMMDTVSTEIFRMSAVDTPVQPDFYSPAITPDSIKPGTMLYNTAGHVSIVYDVRPNGVIMTLNAAPGNTLSVRPFDGEYARANPNNGAGFKNFRPFKITSPNYGFLDSSGNIKSAEFIFQKDNEIPDFNLEQYYGNVPSTNGNWEDGRFVIGGQTVEWTDFVKERMAQGNFKIDPLADFRASLTDLCSGMQDRVAYVDSAIQQDQNGDAVALQSHPDHLPANIYGSTGVWESFSSPDRDLRMRAQAVQILRDLNGYQQKMTAHDPRFQYQGQDLKSDLQKVYQAVDQTCHISYQNSAHRTVTIPSLTSLLKRLPLMSYDPYDCPELRWGASDAHELNSCDVSGDKKDWYSYQQFLRNRLVRKENEEMGWDLNGLKNMSPPVDNSVNLAVYDISQALVNLSTGLKLDVNLSAAINPAASSVVPPLAPIAAQISPTNGVPSAILRPINTSVAMPVAQPAPTFIATNPPVAQPVILPAQVPAHRRTTIMIPPAPSRPVVQPPQCLEGICVGDVVANGRLGGLTGRVTAVFPEQNTLAVKMNFSQEVVMRSISQVRKIQ